MLFNFILNQRTFLALARHEVGPILQALAETPALPDTCQWATFLRNHDEVDLGRLVGHEHDEVFAAFGPDPDMQLYGRGIRRRLAPMLGNDRRRIEMAYALQFSLPGTPVIRYGDEIGMGEDLTLPERNAIRTPMQWSAGPHAGFSTDPTQTGPSPSRHHRRRVRVRDASTSKTSSATPPRCSAGSSERCSSSANAPSSASARARYVDTGERSVLALVHDAPSGAMLAVINLGARGLHDRSRSAALQEGDPIDVFADQDYPGRRRPPRHRHRPLRLSLDPTAPDHRSPSRIEAPASTPALT